MTKTQAKTAARLATQHPGVTIEATLSEVVVPKLDAWLDDLANAVPRVLEDTDGEAVHDLRVALRRIRSLLQVVRPVFGRFYVKRIRDDMKQVASASGSLRDEEVLTETIAALDLPDADRKALGPWLETRAAREKTLRAKLIETLEKGALDDPQTQLRSLIRLPLMPGRDKVGRKFARKIVFEAHAQVEALRTGDITDVVGLHDLRIAYKRLRYSVEAFSPALSPELRAWGRVATKFQKVLGDIHDQDVAIEIVKSSKQMRAATRDVVLDALDRKRTQYGMQYLEMVGFGLVSLPRTGAETSAKKKGRNKKSREDGKKSAATTAATTDAERSQKPAQDDQKASKPAAEPVAVKPAVKSVGRRPVSKPAAKKSATSKAPATKRATTKRTAAGVAKSRTPKAPVRKR